MTRLIQILALFGCFIPTVFGFPDPKIEIIQSVPAGTELAVPGLSFAHTEWVKLIDSAKKTIDVEQMYVDSKSGEVLDEVIAALKRAGQRSVKIRFSVSKKMANTNRQTLDELKKIPNLELALVDLGPITQGIQHSKFWIIDQSVAFVGSQNFDWKSLTHILETGVTFRDPILVQQLASIFELDWKIATTGQKPEDLGTAPAAPQNASAILVASPPALNPAHIPSAFDALSELLNGAKKSVKVSLLNMMTSTYGNLAAWTELENLLIQTAKRGVKIQLLMSHWNTASSQIQTLKKLAKAPGIEIKIATIPDLPGGHIPYSRVNHSKIMIVDSEIFWIGTSNWSWDYFYATRGIEIILKQKQFAQTGDAIFERLWNAPYSEAFDPNRKYPPPIK